MASRAFPASSTVPAHAWAATRRAYAWVLSLPPLLVLSVLAVVQWLALVGLVLSIRHDGWLFYQGGDETFYYSGAWGIAGGHLPPGSVGYGWTLLLAPIALFAGPSYLAALPAVVLLQVLVLLPLGLFFAYGIGERIAGRWLGYVMAVGWVVAPYLVIPGFVHRYHDRWVEQFLPQAFGLTGLSDFFAMVVTAGAAWLFLRYLDNRGTGDAVLAGLLTGLSIGIKPADVLFVAGLVLALLVTRDWRGFVPVGAGAVLPVLTLGIWKERAIGHLPILQGALGHGGTVHGVAGVAALMPAITLPSSLHIDWGHLGDNMAQFREFFWSMRLVEWLPFAGLVALSRVSWSKAAFFLGWLGAFVIVKGTSPRASIPDATFFRLLMPAWPAYLLLAAALPLLVPDVARAARAAVAAAPVPRPIPLRGRAVAVSLALVGLVPLLVLAVIPTLKSRTIVSEFTNNVAVPVGGSFDLQAQRTPQGVGLTWRRPPGARGTVFYRVYWSPASGTPPVGGVVDYREGIACVPGAGAADCQLQMHPYPAVRSLQFVAKPPAPGEWTYRVGMVANWVDEPSRGDVMLVSDPVTVDAG